MRKMSLAWVLLALFVLLSGCALPGGPTPTPESTPIPRSTEVAATLTLYEPPDDLFAISYPSGWQVSTAERQTEFSDAYGMLHILVQYADAGQSVDAATMRTLVDNYFAAGTGNVTEFKREKDTEQADGSILVEYSFTNDGIPGYGSSLFQQRGSYLYILSFWVMQQDLWAPNQSFFATVVQSFQPTPEREWVTLSSVDGHYQVIHPPSWQGSESNGEAIIRKDQNTFIQIVSTPTEPSVDPAAANWLLMGAMTAELRSRYPEAQVETPGTQVVAGQQTYRANFAYMSPGTQLEMAGILVALSYQGQDYRISLYSPSTERTANAQVFSRLLQSFAYLP